MEWVERVTGERVVATRPSHGGITSSTSAVTLASGRVLVLRHDDAEAVAREAAALDLLANVSRLPTPRLVAHEGGTLLMTLLPGSPDLRQPRIAEIRVLADRLHEVVAPQGFPVFERYYTGEPPAWATDAGPWRAAADLVRGAVPEYQRVLIHRDLHPLNLLWSGVACTGVVDWVAACAGPAAFDAAHCKANLAMLHGPGVAAQWPNDPYWDVVGVLDLAPDLDGVGPWHAFGRTDLTLPLVRARLEAYLAQVALRA